MGKLYNPDIKQIRDLHFQRQFYRNLISDASPNLYRVVVGAGAAITAQGRSYIMNTGTAGADKGVEFFEYLKDFPFSTAAEGEQPGFFQKYHYLEGFFGVQTMLTGTQEGLSFYGIELGSFRTAPSLMNTLPATGLHCVQFRYNLALERYEVMVYADLGTANDPLIIPIPSDAGATSLLSLIYEPKQYIKFYLNNELFYFFNDKPLLNSLFAGGIGDDAGFGAFVTGGSNAAGQVTLTLNRLHGFTYLY